MLSLIPFVHAIVVTAPRPKGFENPGALVTGACAVAMWIFAAAIIFSIVMVLLAAFGYMRSSGEPAKLQEANQRLIFVAIGVAVALIAFLFPGMIATLLKAGSVKVCGY